MTREERKKIEDEWITWQRSLNKELTETQYRVIYLPPADLMPYEDLADVTRIQNAVEAMLDDWEENEGNASPVGNLVINENWVRKISMALTVYKTVLMTIHGKKIRKEIKELREKMKED